MIFGSTTFTSVQGHQSDEIETSGLIGNFNPNTGIQTAYWENQVSSGKHLRRFNGLTHVGTDEDAGAGNTRY